MAVAPKQGWVDLSRSFPIVKVHGTAGKFGGCGLAYVFWQTRITLRVLAGIRDACGMFFEVFFRESELHVW
jgi:hypothetical protein